MGSCAQSSCAPALHAPAPHRKIPAPSGPAGRRRRRARKERRRPRSAIGEGVGGASDRWPRQAFLKESAMHGWPSFRDSEVDWKRGLANFASSATIYVFADGTGSIRLWKLLFKCFDTYVGLRSACI